MLYPKNKHHLRGTLYPKKNFLYPQKKWHPRIEKSRRTRKTNERGEPENEENNKETNSTHEENDVSNGHMTRWRNAWWTRADSGPHLRTARGRRRTWRAARATEQALDDDGVEESQSLPEEVRGIEMETRKENETDTNLQCKYSAPGNTLACHGNSNSNCNNRSSSSRNRRNAFAMIPRDGGQRGSVRLAGVI